MIGPEAALALIEHLGGSRLYVATNDQSRSFIRLAEIISREAADKLRTAMGRDDLKVPLKKSWRIQIYRESGMSYGAIANILDVSQSTV